MPPGDICTANIGSPLPLAYGNFRATGMRLIDYTVPSTASSLPNMQVGFWDLGEGELDGVDALWISDELQFAFDPDGNLMGTSTVGVGSSDPATIPTLNAFNFHPGHDSPLLGGSTTGNRQQIDSLWGYTNGLVTPLAYSRRAYYAIGWTAATNDNAQMSPIGDFRGMRCRIFDSSGNQIGYSFTTNPVWHFVDLWLRRAIKPEYAIDPLTGPTALTADEMSRFNWPSITDAAAYCDYVLPNGSSRFQGSYVFASGSTLQAMVEQILLCCRGFMFQYAGQIYIEIDQPRSSTFLLTAGHLVPGSFHGDGTQVNQNANRYQGQFLEVGLPAVATINTITRTATNVKIMTTAPNPCAPGDVISVGGVVDPSFDSAYLIATTPSLLEIDCTISSGAAGSSTGGSIGYIQSRFSKRSPELQHFQHQLAQGHILPPSSSGSRLKRIPVNYDFGSQTYDQANRLLKYEMYRDLGIDQTPYLPPVGIELSAFSESVDINGNALKAQLPGSVITLDPTVFFEFAGDYEIIERYINPFQQEVEDSTDGSFLQAPSRSGGSRNATDSNSGILKLVLRSFNPDSRIFTDTSDAANAGFATVPGQLPFTGGSTGSSGFTVTAGSMTVTSPAAPEFTADGIAAWTSISVRLGSGTVLIYSASSTGGLMAPGGPFYLYINDPTFVGGSGKVFVSAGTPPSGAGIMVLYGPFNTLPSNGVGFPVAHFTVTL